MRFWITKAVFYDGDMAWVRNYILECTKDGKLTKDASERFNKYCEQYDAEVLKIEPKMPVNFDEIIGLKENGDIECKQMTRDFEEMYFA